MPLNIKGLTVLLILFIIFINACGKKLDPKPKDSIIIPPPRKVSLENREEGVYIKNNEEYTLFVEKSSIDDTKCSDNFIFLVKLKPEEGYLDRDVKESLSYVYRFTNLDENYGVESTFVSKSILYSKPIKITNFIISPKPTGEVTISLTFDKIPRGVHVKINNKDLGRFTDNTFTLLLEDKEQNTISITPYDKYNNLGVTKTVVYSNPRVYFITPPEIKNYIIDENSILINWDDIPYAKGYRLYDTKSNKVLDTKVNYAKLNLEKPNSCIEFYISSYNEQIESEKKYIKLCYNQN